MKKISREKLLWLILALAGIIAVGVGFLLPSEEHGQSFWWSHIWAVFALIGFIGCAAMIFIAKWLGRYWLQRKDDYYD